MAQVPDGEMCNESKQVLDDPNVVCLIKRSKNSNVVVYRAAVNNGKLNKDNPLEVFWLKIDPEYVKKKSTKWKKMMIVQN